ncbi:hypothetical protein E4T39_04796 [Aureobasidium subglaciale]|nr:hypothetical protein E4T39_04796 [Aureobasidium subglaciale]
MKTDDSDVFRTLPSLQSRGFIESIGSVGVTTSDDFIHHAGRDSKSNTTKFRNWIDDPLEVLSLYKEAAHAACRLRNVQDDRGLGEHQIFYRHSYHLPTLTDGNAPRPVKKVLRGTWKHDTIMLTVELADEVRSVQAMETVRGNSIDDELPLYNQFIQAMETKFFLWSQRVRKFHQGLIQVVMAGYREDLKDVESRLVRVGAHSLHVMSRGSLGDAVVDAVVRTMGDIRFDNVEVRCCTYEDSRPDVPPV